MSLNFVNRAEELRELDRAARTGGLLVIHGRRRMGKTRLLREWLQSRKGFYSQAIEANPEIQLSQIAADLRELLGPSVEPRSWPELLELLKRTPGPWVACLDEFPYLAATEPSMPSRLQRWHDHDIPKGALLILSGSSTSMMHDLFLNASAPLYGRARKVLTLGPMDYAAFCQACRLPQASLSSFEKYACVGGVPRYWEFVEQGMSPLELADDLYFGFAPVMEDEPRRVLNDEGVHGATATSVLEAIGRGAERPSEIAARLGTAQTNLSRVFQQLLETSILSRELPFGESVRSSRRALYRIIDPALRFWFRVYSPHRSRWPAYPSQQQRLLLHEHASTVFEDHCRASIPGAARHWEANAEFDLIAPDPESRKGLLVAEVKFRKLSATDRKRVLADLAVRWERSSLRARFPRVRFEVFDASLLRD